MDMLPDFLTDKETWRRHYGVLAPYLPELVAMHAGLRDAAQLTLTEADWTREQGRIERFVARAGLHLQVHRKDGLPRVVLAARPLASLPDGEREENLENRFGYPDCCVQRYLATSVGNDFVNRAGDLVGGGGTFPFELNPFLVTTPFHLFKHFPCSLRCDRTRDAGAMLLARIHAIQPALGATVERYGAAPVLFTDICGMGVSLLGSREGDRIRYTAPFWDGHPSMRIAGALRPNPSDLAVFDEIVAALGAGDALRLDEGLLVVERSGRTVARVARPPHLRWALLDFTRDQSPRPNNT